MYIVAALISGSACVMHEPMEELIEGAWECTKQSPDNECWNKVNERLESNARREARREAEKSNCAKGYIEMCDWTGCGCISNREFDDWRRRNRL